ncbi:uncharacterized protein LOC129322763 [Prosopis cineraria]|uniref:uncharacterized protein LOC129322763 n=1 Tax=Prosopis cineraria TaxID=364024 RepID=UPI00240F264A|nr:uncharacterized protein LOC129322763 [Prosopis cineraria]
MKHYCITTSAAVETDTHVSITSFVSDDTEVSISSAATITTSIDKNKKKKKQSLKNTAGEEVDRHGGLAVHSQVMKIKQEIEKLKEPSPEIRRLHLRNINRQRSRSPLGITERAILVGNS